MSKNKLCVYTFLLICIIQAPLLTFAQSIKITNDILNKKLSFGNEKMKALLDYDQQANLSSLAVNGQRVIDGDAGVYSTIKTKYDDYSTLHLQKDPTIKINNNIITVTNINYGDKQNLIHEIWKFTITESDIKFDIERTLSKTLIVEQAATPVFLFKNINIWEGAYQDYGGLAWFYLFNKRSDTYGVHSRSSQFWNSKTNNGLNISVDAPGKEVAMSYSRIANEALAFSITVSPKEMLLRFDSGTNRRRFLRDTTTDVWAPVKLNAGTVKQRITLSYFDFNKKYGRGNFVGINGKEVSDVLNTIARIGVIDKQHFGGNSWHTPYGPICLHEQYIAEMGLAINDKNYLKGYQECLNFYRGNAVRPNGHVISRWAYTNEDAMPGTSTDKGFYEAQWGYLLDANPDVVTNVSELYDQTGDKLWVKTQQTSCEKALDWIIKRDFNNNGLVEMMTDSMQQKKGSDWIDIIWASYENAFVNAKLYHALTLWSKIEKQLGNIKKSDYYISFAQKLKISFNKSTTEGGFWDEENKCYIHWREKDGSIHGRNLVTPVNFMAIAYGICDDKQRTKTILDNIESQMQKENLFFWPLCMNSYAKGEGNDWQFPFPNYENGDIFLSWGSVAVKAYASYKPELALKYVKNVLAQYSKDGLAFQRYGRVKQDGRGDDILSGNSLAIVGLYDAIYGINPLYNRFYLNPHITSELAGTQVRYNYRNENLKVDLAVNNYSVSNKQFKIADKKDFGFFAVKNWLSYFNGNSENASMKITTIGNLSIAIKEWDENKISFSEFSNDKISKKVVYQINGLKAGAQYDILIDGKSTGKRKSSNAGTIISNGKISVNMNEVMMLKM
jgi:hypothetical protein